LWPSLSATRTSPFGKTNNTKLYATAGSNSNVAENGLNAEKMRADVLEVDRWFLQRCFPGCRRSFVFRGRGTVPTIAELGNHKF